MPKQGIRSRRWMQFGLGMQWEEARPSTPRSRVLAEASSFDVVSVYPDLLYQPAIAPAPS